MPLPMVHFGVAIALGMEKKQFPSAEFLAGSIAPDSIHTRPDSDRLAKRKTHLDYQDENGEARMRSFLDARAGTHAKEQAFAAGYVAHILTDQYWIQTVFKAYRDRIPVSLDDSERRKLYYQEADQIDFNLYHHAAWRREVWAELPRAQSVDLSPLLTADEIQQWQDRTLRWFDELKEEPKIDPKYLTDESVATFIGSASGYVAEKLEQWCMYDYWQ